MGDSNSPVTDGICQRRDMSKFALEDYTELKHVMARFA